MCLTGSRKERLGEPARPPKGKAPKPLWGVCGRVEGELLVKLVFWATSC